MKLVKHGAGKFETLKSACAHTPTVTILTYRYHDASLLLILDSIDALIDLTFNGSQQCLMRARTVERARDFAIKAFTSGTD